jgi:hypothetical protein
MAIGLMTFAIATPAYSKFVNETPDDAYAACLIGKAIVILHSSEKKDSDAEAKARGGE